MVTKAGKRQSGIRTVELVVMFFYECPHCKHGNAMEARNRETGDLLVCEKCRRLLRPGRMATFGSGRREVVNDLAVRS